MQESAFFNVQPFRDLAGSVDPGGQTLARGRLIGRRLACEARGRYTLAQAYC